MIKSGQAVAGVFVCRDATGALAAPTAGPAGTLYVDGVSNAAAVTISGANPYKWAVTLPALSAGAVVQIYITATIATIATAAFVWDASAETKRVSDLQDLAAGAEMDLVDAPNTTAVGALVDATWDEGAAGHVAVGSMGKALADANNGAPPAASAISDAVWDEAGAGHVAAGSTGALLRAAGAAMGAGAITFTYTVTSSVDGTPIAGAEVWVSTDAGGSTVVASGVTSVLGQVVFYLDAGTYYFWRQRAGWNFTNPDTEVVS